jgi:hypothetical protein
MSDQILNAFLERQLADAVALTRASDLLDIAPIGSPAQHFLAHFSCAGLVRRSDGSIAKAHSFFVGIQFPADYLRSADPFRVLTWLGPPNVWHPNIAAGSPAICIGRVAPGTGLVELIDRCWALITWNKVTMREDDALNHAACQWARANPGCIPVDTRPLRRRPIVIDAVDISPGGRL